MKLKVLGKVSPFIKNNKSGVGYLISSFDDKYKIMLDCGPGICNNLDLEKDLNNLIIIISHEHLDHYSGLLDLVYAALLYKKIGFLKTKIEVYIPKSFNETADKYLKSILNEDNFSIKKYDENTSINFNDFIIDFKETKHDVKCYGARIKKDNKTLVYLADTGYYNNNLTSFADKCDLLICESTFLKDQIKNLDYHLFAYEAGLIAKKSQVDKLMLTHFWPDIDEEKYIDEAKEVFNDIIKVNEGKIINIGGLYE